MSGTVTQDGGTKCSCGPNEGCSKCTTVGEQSPGDYAYTIFSAQTKFLLGKVLTAIDAAITDRQQNKAVKDIIKQQFRDQEKWVSEICGGPRLICAAGEEMPPTNG